MRDRRGRFTNPIKELESYIKELENEITKLRIYSGAISTAYHNQIVISRELEKALKEMA